MSVEHFSPVVEQRSPVLAKCLRCEHVWPVLWMPCDMRMLGRVAPSTCPWCGNEISDQLVVGSRNAGDLDKYVDWLEGELERARIQAHR